MEESKAAVEVRPFGAPQPLPPYRRLTTDELVEKTFEQQQRWWANAKPSVVAEGVVTSSQVEAVQTGTTDRPCGLVTRYKLSVSQAWITDPGDSLEFWTRGGIFPVGVKPPANCPMGERYSSEPEFRSGDHVLLAVSVGDLMVGQVGQAVNRPISGNLGAIKVVPGDAFGAAYAARWRAEYTRRFGPAIAKAQQEGNVQP